MDSRPESLARGASEGWLLPAAAGAPRGQPAPQARVLGARGPDLLSLPPSLLVLRAAGASSRALEAEGE